MISELWKEVFLFKIFEQHTSLERAAKSADKAVSLFAARFGFKEENGND